MNMLPWWMTANYDYFSHSDTQRHQEPNGGVTAVREGAVQHATAAPQIQIERQAHDGWLSDSFSGAADTCQLSRFTSDTFAPETFPRQPLVTSNSMENVAGAFGINVRDHRQQHSCGPTGNPASISAFNNQAGQEFVADPGGASAARRAGEGWCGDRGGDKFWMMSHSAGDLYPGDYQQFCETMPASPSPNMRYGRDQQPSVVNNKSNCSTALQQTQPGWPYDDVDASDVIQGPAAAQRAPASSVQITTGQDLVPNDWHDSSCDLTPVSLVRPPAQPHSQPTKLTGTSARPPLKPQSTAEAPTPSSSTVKRCQIPGCTRQLETPYNIRYKTCASCVRAPLLRKDGMEARFCQQCGYLHDISEFDGAKRSCRKKLRHHASRVRQWRSARRGSKSRPSDSGLGASMEEFAAEDS